MVNGSTMIQDRLSGSVSPASGMLRTLFLLLAGYMVALQASPSAVQGTYSSLQERHAQVLLHSLLRGDAQHIDEALGVDSPVSGAELRHQWLLAKRRAGKFYNTVSARITKEGEDDLVKIRCRFDAAIVEVQVVFDRRARITDVQIEDVEKEYPEMIFRGTFSPSLGIVTITDGL